MIGDQTKTVPLPLVPLFPWSPFFRSLFPRLLVPASLFPFSLVPLFPAFTPPPPYLFCETVKL
jgi:hypothetical protein